MKHFNGSAHAVAYTAIMTALVAVASMLGINIASGYVNMGDAMIFVTATLLGGVPAMIAGGIGSFIADLIVFPVTMWFTLIIKGLEGLACGLLAQYVLTKITKKISIKITINILFMLLSSMIMIFGYFGTQWLMWGTKESALVQLPWDILQGVVGTVVATLLIYGLRLEKLVQKKDETKQGYKNQKTINIKTSEDDKIDVAKKDE